MSVMRDRQRQSGRLSIGAVVMSLMAAAAAGCSQPAPAQQSAALAPAGPETFGTMGDGTVVDLYTLTNSHGMEARIINYGATLISLEVPDRNGQPGDVVLGYDDLAGYLNSTTFFGATIGRYANRIAKGLFTLDGVAYHLPINDGPNSLHGGAKGFDKVLWSAKRADGPDGQAVQLSYLSRDGEEGYPGNLSVTVTYTLTGSNELRIDYSATTDRKTVLNLTNHSYFNLAGTGDILAHEVMINADTFTPIDATLIPTGVLQPVEGTPLDFRTPTAVGARINEPDPQLKFAGGYDHNWVLNKPRGQMGLAARATDPSTGRTVEVRTTEPGVQFYTGNFLDGTVIGKGGRAVEKRSGLTFETQHYPDSPNHPDFPSTVLSPGETFQSTTVYAFSAK